MIDETSTPLYLHAGTPALAKKAPGRAHGWSFRHAHRSRGSALGGTDASNQCAGNLQECREGVAFVRAELSQRGGLWHPNQHDYHLRRSIKGEDNTSGYRVAIAASDATPAVYEFKGSTSTGCYYGGKPYPIDYQFHWSCPQHDLNYQYHIAGSFTFRVNVGGRTGTAVVNIQFTYVISVVTPRSSRDAGVSAPGVGDAHGAVTSVVDS